MRVHFRREIALCGVLCLLGGGCSNDRPPPPARTVDAAQSPRESDVETPKHLETATAHRAKVGHGAELYAAPWFSAHRGNYDLIVHFHGLGKIQEGNLEKTRINAAVVSINLGAGTDHYSSAFRDPQSFPKLLAETHDELVKSGRIPANARLGRLALSAWSAGYVSVERVMSEATNAEKIDAVLLADGFFTSFTDKKKRTINTKPLDRFVRLAELAERDEKLFAITHSAIPTADYPSMDEVCGKFLELLSVPKAPSKLVGPRNMHETYAADRGSFHLKGYEGVTAKDHIDQIRAMGETLWPYLRERWEKADKANREKVEMPAQAAPKAPAQKPL